jgi:hypothetical protein
LVAPAAAPSRRSRGWSCRARWIVDQQHALALELLADGIELLAHRLLAHGLARHDEGAADIAVLDEALAERDAQRLRQLHGRRAAGIGNRDDDVDFVDRNDRLTFSASNSPMARRAS